MDGPEKADGEEGDGGADRTDDGVDRPEACPPGRVFDALAQHEVGDVDQLRDCCGCQARVPRPPRVPDGPGPDGAQHNRNEEEYQADLDGCYFDDIPLLLA